LSYSCRRDLWRNCGIMSDNAQMKDFFGPLSPLIGKWEGDKGMDVSPEKDGEEMSPYFETIMIEPVGDATNAAEQTLVVLSYKQIVSRKADGQVFHHQTGYWYFEKKTGEVLYSLTIPRAVSVLAKGSAKESGGKTEYEVRAVASDKNYGIIESSFMAAKASTKGFTMRVTVDGDKMQYKMNTALRIYDRDFDHSDENSLNRKDLAHI
jgi:hypothetical protein